MSKIFKRHTGGGFTGNQLRDLFASGYNHDIKEAEKSLNIGLLDASDNDLCNNTFTAYYSIDKTQPRFIVIHNGTFPKASDWGNNARNIFGLGFYDKNFLTTNRNRIAKNGSERLVTYLIELYNNNNNNVVESKKYIITLIQNKINHQKSNFTNISVDDAVEELLKEYLTTIGHSQGAIYAYLYGHIGKETIVYNPAPYHGKKPDNTYLIRRKGDIVSYFTTASDNSNNKTNQLDKIKDGNIVQQHSIEPLDNIQTIFGNKFLYNTDIELELENQLPIHNSNVFIEETPDDLKNEESNANISTDKSTSQGGSITRRSINFKFNKTNNKSKKKRNKKTKQKNETKKRNKKKC